MKQPKRGMPAVERFSFYMPAPPQAVNRVDYDYNEDGSPKSATLHFERCNDLPGVWVVQDDRDSPARNMEDYHEV